MTLEDYVKNIYLAEVKHQVTSYFIDNLEYVQIEVSDEVLKKYSIDNFDRFSIKTEQITDALNELKEFEYFEGRSETWDGLAYAVWEELSHDLNIVYDAAFIQFNDRWKEIWLARDGDLWADLEEYFYEAVVDSIDTEKVFALEVELPKSKWQDLTNKNEVDFDEVFNKHGGLYHVTDFYYGEEFSKICNTLGIDKDALDLDEERWSVQDLMDLENFDFYIDEVDYVYNSGTSTPTEVLEQVGQIRDTLQRIQKDVPDINVKDSLIDEPPEIMYTSMVEEADIAKIIEGKNRGMHTCLITSTVDVEEDILSLGNISPEFAPHIDTVYLILPEHFYQERDKCISLRFPKFEGQFAVLNSEKSLIWLSSALSSSSFANISKAWAYVSDPSLYLHIDAGDNASLSIELYKVCETFDLRVNSTKKLNVNFSKGSRDKWMREDLSLSVDTGPKAHLSVADTYSTLSNVTIYKGCSIPELIQYKADYRAGTNKKNQSNLFPTQFEVVSETAIAYNKAFSKFEDVLWQNSRRKTEFKVVYYASVGTPESQLSHLNNLGPALWNSDFTKSETDARGVYIAKRIVDSNNFAKNCAGAVFYKCFFIDKVPMDTISVNSLNDNFELTIA